MPPLGDHVGDVICVRPEEQVIGAHAARVVAAVKDMCVVRYVAAIQLPRESVSKNRVLPCAMRNAVAAFVAAARPFPAIDALANPSPETLL
jgi:hypothetical protein